MRLEKSFGSKGKQHPSVKLERQGTDTSDLKNSKHTITNNLSKLYIFGDLSLPLFEELAIALARHCFELCRVCSCCSTCAKKSGGFLTEPDSEQAWEWRF